MSHPAEEDNFDILTLFGKNDGVTVVVHPIQTPRMKGTMEKRFEAFHLLNPHVYEAVVKVALDLKGRGFKRGGVKMIFERLRWLYALHTQGDHYKLNNNYTAFYAGLVMATVPALDGFFETRSHKGSSPYEPDLKALGF